MTLSLTSTEGQPFALKAWFCLWVSKTTPGELPVTILVLEKWVRAAYCMSGSAVLTACYMSVEDLKQ